MNFTQGFKAVVESLQREQVGFALIGGLALGVAGVARATMDIDFLVLRDDVLKVKRIMQSLGYALLHEGDEVAHFIHQNASQGRVDFLYAHRRYAREMLGRAREEPVLGGLQRLKVLGVEDQIGLKVQSSANNSSRYHQDMADIEALIRAHRTGLDLERIKRYFELFDRGEEFERLRQRAASDVR